MTILGVDLGTTNSLAVVYKEGNPVLIPNAYGEYAADKRMGRHRQFF